jgi:hypothetical protein
MQFLVYIQDSSKKITSYALLIIWSYYVTETNLGNMTAHLGAPRVALASASIDF